MTFTKKTPFVGLVFLLACGDVNAIDLESLVMGEQPQIANDTDRYNFVRYELMRSQTLGLNEITTCEAKELQNKLISEFDRLKLSDYASYRDYGFCYYLKNVNLMEPSADIANEWLSSNYEKVHYYHSHEAVMDYYVAFDSLSDWQCNNLRGFLFEYKEDANQDHPLGLKHLRKHCS